MKKVFRPFWSYRIAHTEQWLENEAEQGWHLTSINLFTRQFTMKQEHADKLQFRIIKSKSGFQNFNRLEEGGWSKSFEKRDWTILAANQPSLYPVRDKLLHRNQWHMYTWFTLLLFYFLTSLPFLLNDMFYFSYTSSANEQLIPIVMTCVYVILMAFLYMLYQEHLELQQAEMGMNNDVWFRGKPYYKLRLVWIYDLVRTEKWLEQMATKGYVVRKVYAFGFIFDRVKPHQRAYECTFRFNVDTSYFSMFKEHGWELHYSSKLSFLNYTIWSMTYDEQESKPAITYVKQEKLQNLNRTYLFHLSFTLLLTCLMALNLYPIFTYRDPLTYHPTDQFFISFYAVFFIFWLVLSLNIIWTYIISRRKIVKDG